MNRHLYGAMLPVQANVPDCVAVKPGDLMFVATAGRLDLNKALRTKSGNTSYCYPMAAGTTHSSHWSGTTTLAARFIGVALDDSPYGSTDTISVATAGVFEFPLAAAAGVTLGYLAKAKPSGYSAGSATTASYQLIPQSGGGVSVGWVQKTEVGAKTVRVMIRTLLGPGGIATY